MHKTNTFDVACVLNEFDPPGFCVDTGEDEDKDTLIIIQILLGLQGFMLHLHRRNWTIILV